VVVPIGSTCVPGGVVSLGVANDKVCPPTGCPLEMPEHKVALAHFVIDDHEVTVKRFRDWWKLGHVGPKEGDEIFTAGDGTQVRWAKGWVVAEPAKNDGKNDSTWLGQDDATNDAAPINFVDWPTALAFCVADGGRLPTEAEWETTASGHANRLFPFSADGTKKNAPAATELTCDKAISAVLSPCPFKTTATTGFSPDNAYDLAGSVAEWVLDAGPAGGAGCTSGCYPASPLAGPLVYNEAAKLRGVRGGHWADKDAKRLRAQARDFLDLLTKDAHVGFRCVSK
jgi:formylglycine-generating enzyme required for sulfatase activity